MKTEQLDSNKRIAFPVCFFSEDTTYSAELASEIHVVPCGKWMHWSGIEFEITSDTIAEIVKNYNAGARKDIPITAGHDNGMSGGELPAVGWFKELIDHGVNGLYAYVEWNEEGKELLRKKSFKYFSAELTFDFKDLETGDEYKALLVGGALTNKPFFKKLDMDPADNFSEDKMPVLSFSVPDVINQFNLQDMDLATLLAKAIADLSVEEKAFIVEHKDELTDEQKTSHASVIVDEAPAETEAEKAAREEKETGDANEAAGLNRDGSAKEVVPPVVEASENKTVQVSASEFAATTAMAQKGAEALAKLKKMELSEKVGKLVLSSSNKNGRIAAAEKGSVVTFMEGLSDTQIDQFVNIMNKLPKTAMFSEIGDGGDEGAADAKAKANKINELALSEIQAHPGMKYAQATKNVLAAHPELAIDGEDEEGA